MQKYRNCDKKFVLLVSASKEGIPIVMEPLSQNWLIVKQGIAYCITIHIYCSW